MSSLLLPRRFYSQPQGAVSIDRANPLGKTITHCLPFNGSGDIVTGKQVSLANGTYVAGNRGLSLRGPGSNCASVPLDLSSSTKLSFSCWVYWDAYANDDDLLVELGGANSLFFDINSGYPASGYIQISTAMSDAVPYGGQGFYFTRPSAAAWHHYAIYINREVESSAEVFIDGAAVSRTYIAAVNYQNKTSTIPFSNDTLYLFSRAGTSLFGNGNIQNLIFRSGYKMTPEEVKSEYLNPWQIFKASE